MSKREELIRARLDEYNFIAQMIAGIEKEGWYKRRISYLNAVLYGTKKSLDRKSK